MNRFSRLTAAGALVFAVAFSAAAAANITFDALEAVPGVPAPSGAASYGQVISFSVGAAALTADMSFPAPHGSGLPASPVVGMLKSVE